MLNKRNLDDQTYQSILETAMSRLPWICSAWTDHNAHDPGVTVLEMMAWYKEMQQYQLSQFTDELRGKLLKLAGIRCRPASPAVCAVYLPDGGPARPARSRLTTSEGVPFELEWPVPERTSRIEHVLVDGTELLEMLRSGRLTFQPFRFGGRPDTGLCIGLSSPGQGDLRIWFEVEPPVGAARNPFDRDDQQPRTLEWKAEGLGAVAPLRDETHALSQSGYVTFSVPRDWPADTDGLRWLSVRQTDGGCEEAVRLSKISVSRWEAVQRETRACSHSFAAPKEREWTVLLDDATSRRAELAVFLRRNGTWEQTNGYESRIQPEGRSVCVDTTDTEQDGGKNVLIVCLDPEHCSDLIFDARGLPGETFFLNLGGREVLTEGFTLLCQTLDADGSIRPTEWHCADDFYVSSPRDRVFTYDPLRETITFGDGEHGALLQAGGGAVLVTGMTLSLCGGGNIPAGTGMRFTDDGAAVRNESASGGVGYESAAEASVRFLQLLENTQKCASAADYERLALTTPGLRVGAARALPGYDPDEPTGASRTPTVTVVVAPASENEKPLPDSRFLAAVQERLERYRPVCTRVRAVPPAYQGVLASVRLTAREAVSEAAIRGVAERYLSADGAGIGGVLRPGELSARLQAIPGVLRVARADLRAPGPGCYQNTAGEIQLPPCTIPCLQKLELILTPAETAGE